MKLLITGVAGFIGTNFIKYYLKKYDNREIIGLDNLTYAGNVESISQLEKLYEDRFLFVKGDIRDSELVNNLFQNHIIDGVINFAAESHVDRSISDPEIFLQTNILGTFNLLNTAMKYWREDGEWAKDKKFLQISTDEVYGSLGEEGLFTEQTPIDPHSPYSASKASADHLVNAFHDTYGMPTNITRCSNNYGYYQYPEKLIPVIIKKALNHEKIPIYGDGLNIRDWLFVEDHCIAIDLVYETGKISDCYNIGSNNEITNLSLTEAILHILKEKTGDNSITKNLINFVEDRPGHDRRYGIDSSKIAKLGWKPLTTFEQGLEITIEWYLQNRDYLTSND
ncbi:MAG: dTDP-glucose 4,6-dehydratase [Candidatus Kariarchaeaceae archaeon]|jgi:dTDP-glucose 4,6-dehydratase